VVAHATATTNIARAIRIKPAHLVLRIRCPPRQRPPPLSVFSIDARSLRPSTAFAGRPGLEGVSASLMVGHALSLFVFDGRKAFGSKRPRWVFNDLLTPLGRLQHGLGCGGARFNQPLGNRVAGQARHVVNVELDASSVAGVFPRFDADAQFRRNLLVAGCLPRSI